jgi:hypothetical protein
MAHSGMKTSVASGHLRMFRRFIQLNGVTKHNPSRIGNTLVSFFD